MTKYDKIQKALKQGKTVFAVVVSDYSEKYFNEQHYKIRIVTPNDCLYSDDFNIGVKQSCFIDNWQVITPEIIMYNMLDYDRREDWIIQEFYVLEDL